MPRAVFAFAMIFVLFSSCTQNNVTEDADPGQYLEKAGLTGSFGLFDNGQGHFTVWNLGRFRDSAYQPAGSFDIVQSLIAVQTGVVRDDSTVIVDGSAGDPTYPDSGKVAGAGVGKVNCGGRLTLQQAFQGGCDAAFGALALRIGKDTLKKWIDSLGYGNRNVSGPLDAFWLNDQLTVRADEELGLMKKLYFNQLPFFQHTQVVVRRMMKSESNANYVLTYKTGTGVRGNGHAIGWVAGWLEENKHPYFFVLNWEASDPGRVPGDKGLGIVKSILGKQGFFQGKK